MKYFETSDGLSLAYDDQGAGHPVLCLAGLTRNMADFEPLMAARADAARFIRLDARGRGASDRAADFMTYDVAVEARDAVELLNHLGIERAMIVGTSRGGLQAMVIAASLPQRLSAVLLNDIGPEIAGGGLDVIMQYLGRRPAAKTYEDAAQATAAFNAERFPTMTAADWLPHVRRFYDEKPDGLHLRYDPKLRDAILAQAEAGPMPDLWPLFDALSGIPTGVLRGAHSDLLTAETVERMKARHPDLLTGEVPNRGHVPFLDEAESLSLFDCLLERAT
ncbi:pimeloyl-ACP methyl ester carboxylesterase [Rubricella aquisinus]|uniref:Pimeloyl-ACP methyl ester carboxylesterase n=1 Tax=Rubricella aquisinus TaxID=2028108 RepID=A0A840WPI7_9RHOB|nr:alpha/beta hydrolase [Rubricella aquisinus]MBB5516968.1 pimeloyl-ACP methyl ester carboxylesterase [Rubricella aquisinus]